MTAVASEGAPGTRHELRQRLRSTVLGPRGGGTTRRRASDAFRLALAVVVVLVSIPVMRANSAAELSIVRAVHPPPAAISWLVTTVFWLGSAGVIVLLVIIGLLVPRLTAIRWTAVAGVLTWGVCALLGVILGSAAGRPPADALAGLNTGYPVTQLAIAVAVAATALPYLSRPVHRVVSLLLTLAVLAGVCGGQALPVNAISSVALGWGIAAALHLAVGSPLGLASAAEITEWITDLRITARDITRAPRQVWGVELFTGRDEAGEPIELSVYGRDASDARVLAKLWRFCLYRDSGPTLILDRLQQVEHEAYLTLMAGRGGLLVPDVLAAGRFGPSRDAALVTRLPDGPALSQADGAGLADATLDEILLAVVRLRDARIAHGALGGDTIVVSDQGICVRDFRRASASAPAGRLDGDLAAALGAMAVRAGPERTAAAAARVLDADTARAALVHLQRSALDPVTVAALQHHKRQGYEAEAAVSAGAIATTASWTVKTLLFLIALPFAAGSFHAPSGSGGDQAAVWIILAVILAVGIAAALIALVPRLRRLVSRRVRPHLLNIWANVKTIATEPHKIVYVLAGSTLAQLLVILALGSSLHAVGEHASIATLITVNTLAAILGGAVPVPGGLGVVEAGLIAGLTSAGMPQDQAVAAVLIQRFFTSYLPPVWGWVTLAWMRRREYV